MQLWNNQNQETIVYNYHPNKEIVFLTEIVEKETALLHNKILNNKIYKKQNSNNNPLQIKLKKVLIVFSKK